MFEARFWESLYDKWIENVDEFERPPPHPDPAHWWNTCPELADLDTKDGQDVNISAMEDREVEYR